ncbi:hypothetical protein ACH5A2_32205 [Streptomyces collinus]|uniref:hypothetical protein n=1 Tax=Streptomyces collinus TaxID=42684 RepID=UPI0037A2E1A0
MFSATPLPKLGQGIVADVAAVLAGGTEPVGRWCRRDRRGESGSLTEWWRQRADRARAAAGTAAEPSSAA